MKGMPVVPQVTEYLYRKATAAGTPLSGTFELTPVCNLDCKMCYVRLSKGEQEAIAPLKTAADWLRLAAAAKEAGMLYLLLTGGEPFAYPGFRQLLEGLHRMGFLVSVNTNGTLIDENTVAWLKRCPPLRLNISLYGASAATYERLCGDPGGSARVTKAVRLLRQADISVKLNCSLTPENAADLEKIDAFAKENDLPLQVATYMFPPVRRDETMVGKNARFTPEEAAYYMALADRLTLGKERFLETRGRYPGIADPEDPCSGVGDGIRCRAGRCSFWVTWQGTIMPCGMFPGDGYPNVFKMPFSDAWEAVKRRAAEIRLPAECAACGAAESCRACAAMVVAESGCFHKKPQYRCHMMKACSAAWERVKEEML